MDVWTYWEGEQPPIIQQCLERTAAMYEDRFHFIDSWPTEFGPRPNCAPNYRACLLRYEILYRYGGHYVDADCIQFRDFDILHGGRDLTTVKDKGGMCDNHYISVSHPRHPIVGLWRELAWLKYQKGLLTRYTALGKHVLNTEPGKPIQDNSCIMPVHWKHTRKFYEEGTPEQHQENHDRNAFCYMLTRGVLDQEIKPRSFMAWLLEQPWRDD